MNVIPFPRPKDWVQPIVELYTPAQTANGLYEVFVWKNRNRSEGFKVQAPTKQDAHKIVRAVKKSFAGKWKRGRSHE